LPQFLQSVTPMPKCPDCQPKGLISSGIAFKP
jgi:hypothetical protein